MAPATWTRAINELMQKGLIKIVKQGNYHAATKYSLSDNWKKFF